jgi:succinate dehydrogenase/fumarate reductase cytochrome b subunit
MKHITIRKIHFVSGVTLTIFIGLHLANHLASIAGVDRHIEWMNALRHFYRAPIIEILLLAAVLMQMYSGIRLFLSKRKTTKIGFEKLHVFSKSFFVAKENHTLECLGKISALAELTSHQTLYLVRSSYQSEEPKFS